MDRQDIDALLIGALYGELAPAEEARLAAHLESHPADKSAFEGLKSARQAVRDSRIFEQQLEPPQALSALLLQEAHRRAPREAKEGWFQRLVRGFAAHPALAAAAMLVIVLGFAGVLHHHGASVAERTVATEPPAGATASALDEPAAPAVADDKATAAAAPGAGVAASAGSGYVVGLADGVDEAKTQQAEHQAHAVASAGGAAASAEAPRRHEAAHATEKREQGIVVDGRDREPKDLDTAANLGGYGLATRSAQAQAPQAGMATPARAPQPAMATPPPPPPAQIDDAMAKRGRDRADQAPVAPAPAAAPSGAVRPSAAPAPRAADPHLAWAKQQHAAAVAAANRGDCTGAARIALAVERQVPAYYDQVMATDRALAHCKAYIASAIERQKDADAKAASHAQTTDQSERK